ncbi:MAG: DUF4421 domain-containing protein [Cyclobacteriaceae bacterium]|nr:DUF4421 domain-containing protein [Cyclobacteriaceae bacterium]
MSGWRAGILLIALMMAQQVSGQKYDSAYIKSYRDKFFVWPVTKQRQLSFRLQDPGDGGKNVEFKPNNAYGLGLGVYLFDLGLEFVFPMPVAQDRTNVFGSTRSTDLQLNILSRRWGGDVVYQRYKGFYLSNPDPPLPSGTPYPQRPDIVSENLGINGVYVFNARKFSLRSSFTFADRQLKSSGGFLLSGSFNLFEIDGDSAILNPAYSALLGQQSSFTSLDYRTYAVAPGYSHNFIIRKNFFVSLLFALGPAVQDFRYTDDNGVHHKNTRVNSFLDARMAIGYSNDKFFTGITVSSQSRNLVIDDIRFSSITTTGRILFGWRFSEWGFLKRSVWELLPPWGKKNGQ